MVPIEPGIYRVSFDEYARWDAANHSKLKHFSKTAAHARWEMLHQEESTRYQDLGHLLHTAILEPERYKVEEPLVAPDVDRRTKLGKAEWNAFVAEARGHPIVTADEKACLDGVLRSLQGHATAMELLYGGFGINELSIVWDDPESKVRSKGRIDRLTEYGGRPWIVDLKSMAKVASTHNWQKAVQDYGYHEQAAFYRAGLQVLRPIEVQRGFTWVVIETEPPWAVRCFEADDVALDLGADLMGKYLAAYAHCRETNSWPAWPEGMELAGLPAWAMKRYDLE